jgi:hypothetical protein
MNPVLERRLKQQRARVLVRSWEYRQRRHARGAWFRLRRVLTDAAAAYVVSADDARQLIGEGYRAKPVGEEFEPPKVIVFAAPERVARLAHARPVPVRLGGELLLADHLVLVPFTATGTNPPLRAENERD